MSGPLKYQPLPCPSTISPLRTVSKPGFMDKWEAQLGRLPHECSADLYRGSMTLPPAYQPLPCPSSVLAHYKPSTRSNATWEALVPRSKANHCDDRGLGHEFGAGCALLGEGERVGFVASRKGLMGPGSNIYRFASPTRQSEYGGGMSTANQLVWW